MYNCTMGAVSMPRLLTRLQNFRVEPAEIDALIGSQPKQQKDSRP